MVRLYAFELFKNFDSLCVIFFPSIGTPFRRYHSYTEPYNLEQDIKYLLGEADYPSNEGNAIDYHENKRNPKKITINVGGTLELNDMN